MRERLACSSAIPDGKTVAFCQLQNTCYSVRSSDAGPRLLRLLGSSDVYRAASSAQSTKAGLVAFAASQLNSAADTEHAARAAGADSDAQGASLAPKGSVASHPPATAIPKACFKRTLCTGAFVRVRAVSTRVGSNGRYADVHLAQ